MAMSHRSLLMCVINCGTGVAPVSTKCARPRGNPEFSAWVYLPYKLGCCSRQTVSSLARSGLPQQTAQLRVDCPPPCRQVLKTRRQRPSTLTYHSTDSHLRESWKYSKDLVSPYKPFRVSRLPQDFRAMGISVILGHIPVAPKSDLKSSSMIACLIR